MYVCMKTFVPWSALGLAAAVRLPLSCYDAGQVWLSSSSRPPRRPPPVLPREGFCFWLFIEENENIKHEKGDYQSVFCL